MVLVVGLNYLNQVIKKGRKIPLKYLLLYNPVSGKGKFKQKIAKLAIFSAYGQTRYYESKFQGDLINVCITKRKV